MIIDFKLTQRSLVQHLEEIVELIQNLEMPTSFNTYSITSSEIKQESFVRQFVKKLPDQGSHIYWLEVDNPNQLANQFEKKTNEVTCKLARYNKNTGSKFVYVGSCTKTKLANRILQHFGWGNAKTYSLQLAKWVDDPGLKFFLSYVNVNEELVVQYIEDQLHKELKPLFGKPGGNNKIKVIN